MSARSDRSGGVFPVKSESGTMSRDAYVSVIARSRSASSSGVRPPSMVRKNPIRLIIFERRIFAADSSSRGGGRSKGLMWWGEVSDMLKFEPPTACERYSYSRSGSMMITSVPNMSVRKISSFMEYDFPAPETANEIEFAFSSEKRSKRIKLLLWRLMPKRIPLFEVRSNDTNGNVEEMGEEFKYVWMRSLSVARGRVELKPSSC